MSPQAERCSLPVTMTSPRRRRGDGAVLNIGLGRTQDHVGGDRAVDRHRGAFTEGAAAGRFGRAVDGGDDGGILDHGDFDVTVGRGDGRILDIGLDRGAHIVDHDDAADGDRV